MGKKADSNKVKQLRGSKQRNIKNNPKPKRVSKMWRTPSFFGSHAKKFWKEKGALLIKLGVLTELDQTSFEALCTIYQHLMEIRAELSTQDLSVSDARGGQKKNPLLTLEQQYANLYKKFADDFGLTPRSRQGLDIRLPKSKKGRFAQFLPDDDDDLLSGFRAL